MPRGRARLPLLAEIAGPAPGAAAWSLRRGDFERLGEALPSLEAHRVVLVAGEGGEPAVAAVGLATAASAAGRRTVLVDCGAAQPRLAAQIGLADAPGLHEYLRWEAEPADVLQPIVLAGPAASGLTDPLVCISAGRPATKAETLLGLRSFAHMVGKLREAYELVLLLSPPVLTEPGSSQAAAVQADAVVAGLREGEAKGRGGRGVRAAIRRLSPAALGSIVVTGAAWIQRS
jgi:Mrp family chromosome partitioning ATPase